MNDKLGQPYSAARQAAAPEIERLHALRRVASYFTDLDVINETIRQLESSQRPMENANNRDIQRRC